MRVRLYKTIDFYITKKFLGTFFYSIALIVSVAVVFDMSENLDEFLSKNITGKEIVFNYYLNFIPYFANLFSPLFTFIAVIFFTSKMAYNTEIIAILSSGVSFRRLMRPYIVSALLLTAFTFVLGNYVIPPATKTLNEFKFKYITTYTADIERMIHRQIEPGVYIYISSFGSDNVGYGMTIEKFENSRLVEKLTADNVRWDDTKKKWVINNYWIRRIYDNREEFEKGYLKDTTLNMVPDDYKVVKDEMETYTTPRLIKEIKVMKQRGIRTTEWEIERHKRVAGPFSMLILTIIGAGLASRKIKGGLGFHLGLGILLSFSYIMFMQVSTVFAISGTTPPLVAVWIPNLLYSIIALFIYNWAAK